MCPNNTMCIKNIVWRFLGIKPGLWDIFLAIIMQASSGTCVAKTPWLLAGSGDSGGQKMIL